MTSSRSSRTPRIRPGAVVIYVAFAVLAGATALAEDPAPSTGPESEEESWIGRSVKELKASWGEPAKIKRAAEGRKVYHFRRSLTMFEVVELPGVSFGDAGVGPSPGVPSPREGGSRGTITKEIGASEVTISTHDDPFDPMVVDRGAQLTERPVATRKAKFWVDERGVVVAEEIGPLVWKKGYGPDRER